VIGIRHDLDYAEYPGEMMVAIGASLFLAGLATGAVSPSSATLNRRAGRLRQALGVPGRQGEAFELSTRLVNLLDAAT
jgi:hypothetical protein